MTRHPYWTIGISCALLLMASIAIAQYSNRICGSRYEVVTTLRDKHKEQVEGRGLRSSGGVIEVWVAQDNKWSIVLSLSDGQVCIVGSGTDWQWIKGKAAYAPTARR